MKSAPGVGLFLDQHTDTTPILRPTTTTHGSQTGFDLDANRPGTTDPMGDPKYTKQRQSKHLFKDIKRGKTVAFNNLV